MGEIEGLRARAEGLGVKVDGRWGIPKLTKVIADAEAEAGLSDKDILDIADVAAAEVVADLQPASADIPHAEGIDVGFTSDRCDEHGGYWPAEECPDCQPVDDGWPERIAPCAWLDQDGVRHTDMGLAYEAAQRIRERDT